MKANSPHADIAKPTVSMSATRENCACFCTNGKGVGPLACDGARHSPEARGELADDGDREERRMRNHLAIAE
eukprot:6206030-Pleurochrysis_carterae.AAC.1